MTDVLRHDPTSITGISYLINQEKADRNLELDAMEQALVNPALMKGHKQINPDEEFVKIMRGLGIDANDDSIVDLVDRSVADEDVDDFVEEHHHSMPPRRPDSPDIDRWNMREPPTTFAPPPQRPQTNEPIPLSSFRPPERRNTDYASQYQSQPSQYQTSYGNQNAYGNQPNYNQYSNGYGQQGNFNNQYPPYGQRPYYPNANPYAELDQGLMNYQGGYQNYNERMLEDQEDTKIIMLEDINELRDELQTMQKSITGIDAVSADTDYATIKRVHERLRRRYDHARGESLGTDFILAIAQGLGSFFDGTRKIGPWRPYLKGWHNSVRPKLRRMRYETATTVSNILTAYDIGPSTRMIIELAPSAVIYSWQHSGEDKDYQYTPDQVASAYEDIRDLV